MAEVKMPLEELRELERERDDLAKQISRLLDEKVDLKEELAKVVASKQIVEKTVTRVIEIYYSVDVKRLQSNINVFLQKLREFGDKDRFFHELVEYFKDEISGKIRDTNLFHVNLGRSDYSLYPALQKHTAEKITMAKESGENISIRYLNFEDVQSELKKQAEEAVARELGELRVKTRNLNTNLAEQRAKLEEEFRNAEQLYRDELEENNKSWSQKYDSLQSDFIALKEGKDMRTAEEKLRKEIEELKEELEYQQNRPWWKKVLNIA